MDSTKHHTSMPFISNSSGKIDLARSLMIEAFQRDPKWDWLLSFDTDALVRTDPDPNHPGMNLDRVIELLEEDRELYDYDLIGAPTLTDTGAPNFGFRNIDEIARLDGTTPFQADWTSGAFLAFTRRGISKLRVLEEGESTSHQKFKLFCVMGGGITEDASLCKNYWDSGMRVGLDPRICVGHRKEYDVYLDPKWWAIQAQAAKTALAERRRRMLVPND